MTPAQVFALIQRVTGMYLESSQYDVNYEETFPNGHETTAKLSMQSFLLKTMAREMVRAGVPIQEVAEGLAKAEVAHEIYPQDSSIAVRASIFVRFTDPYSRIPAER